jgi:2-polyprenyl-6-methoxyphenol hydroxylase-like FAD-dependent oxidoreductase
VHARILNKPSLASFKLTARIGDFIVIGDSAVKVFDHWPQLKADYDEMSYKVDAYYSRHNGEPVVGPVPLKATIGRPLLRRNLVSMLEAEVVRQKIPILFNKKVSAYFETEDVGGIELSNGQRMTADVVVACDGLHSASWQVITQKKDDTISSGSAVYRTSVSADYIFQKDPSLREHFGLHEGRQYLKWFNGPGVHGLVFSDGETICWSIHHPVSAYTLR